MCVRIYVHVSIHACISEIMVLYGACMYVCMFACIHVCVFVCMYACIYVFRLVCVCVCVVCARSQMRERERTRESACVCVCVCACVCARARASCCPVHAHHQTPWYVLFAAEFLSMVKKCSLSLSCPLRFKSTVLSLPNILVSY